MSSWSSFFCAPAWASNSTAVALVGKHQGGQNKRARKGWKSGSSWTGSRGNLGWNGRGTLARAMGCVGCNGLRANIGTAEGLVQTRTGLAGDDLEKKNRRRHSQFNSSLSHSQANDFMRKIFAWHFSFDLTLILKVFSAQKKFHLVHRRLLMPWECKQTSNRYTMYIWYTHSDEHRTPQLLWYQCPTNLPQILISMSHLMSQLSYPGFTHHSWNISILFYSACI